MVVDKTGESAIITYNKNGLVVTKREKNYHICTNFKISCNKSRKKPHWYSIGYRRFKKVRKHIKDFNGFMNIKEKK
jgi:ribosomal protein S18 acetylase RimI-like enzyme